LQTTTVFRLHVRVFLPHLNDKQLRHEQTKASYQILVPLGFYRLLELRCPSKFLQE
jgi:hypothetical protein